VTPARLGAELSQAVQRGVKTISLLGGEPTVHAHTILELAAAAPQRLPLALNTNMYMTPAVLDLLDGVVDWYLADFKFGRDTCAERIADVPNYTAVVQRNLRLAAARANVIVRHVLLPGHLECCFRPIVDWLGRTLPGARFQLYPGYVPCGAGGDDPALGRLNTRAEVCAAEAYLRKTSLRTAAASPHADPPRSPASAAGTGDVTITLGVDGHVYCHDLTPEVSAALAALRPDAGRVDASEVACATGEETA
jgi:putative pyruvate formate lyase activating enzyme